MSAVRGVRGATTAKTDTASEVVAVTRELLETLIAGNGIAAQDVAGVWFTATSDLNSEFPAAAARELGWVDVPLLCAREMEVGPQSARSVARCIRVLLLVNTTRAQAEMSSAYLRGAAAIKAELERARTGASPTQLVEDGDAAHPHPHPTDRDPSPSEQVEEP